MLRIKTDPSFSAIGLQREAHEDHAPLSAWRLAHDVIARMSENRLYPWRNAVGRKVKRMCLSESVSFGVGGGLVAAGALASWKAFTTNKRYLPVAMMPALVVQQFTEGHVWMGLNDGSSSMVWWAAIGYIAFSWLVWPVWIPSGVYVLEPPGSRREKLLLFFALVGLLFGLLLYVPHLFNPDWVRVYINENSISYEDTMFLDYLIPRWLTYAIYLFLITTPPLLSSYFHMRLFGLTLALITTVVWLFLFYAYISFFCLLAGIGSLHLLYIIFGNKCCREEPDLFAIKTIP